MERIGRALFKGTMAFNAAVPMIATAAAPVMIAGHVASFDKQGHLRPWIAWNTALNREMAFYERAPSEHGYPIFVTTTFLDEHWQPLSERSDTIPATQNGMGIMSYLAFYTLRGRHNPHTLAIARGMGDYLSTETLTPDSGKYPRFPHSTGKRARFPQPPDSGTQADRPYEIEPDKGGIVGVALMQLYDVTGDDRYKQSALHIARVLVANQQPGDATHSPWPFRVDYRDGKGRGAISSNMTYIVRLDDMLLTHGYAEFKAPRAAVWLWIATYQIPSARSDGALFAQFFEDHDNPDNRNAWAPLNLARYLLQQRGAVDPHWLADAGSLIQFVRKHFTHQEFGITVCHEQDEDHDAWGGINSTYGAVLAMYAKATNDPALAQQARDALTFSEYAIDAQGHPRDLLKHPVPGGWQEDAHTDVIHNFVDALTVYPEWGE